MDTTNMTKRSILISVISIVLSLTVIAIAISNHSHIKQLKEENYTLGLELYAEKQATQQFLNQTDKYIQVQLNQPFRITHYHANCHEGYCKTGNTTSTGTTPTPYWTIATDPAVILPGTFVVIDNHLYKAEDAGVYGNVIDICVSSHNEAIALGTYYSDVTILRKVKP